MRRFAILVLALGLFAAAPAVRAQEHEGSAKHSQKSESEEGGLEVWKWANFVLLAAFLGYIAVKSGGPFFAGRLEGIRKEMAQSADLARKAEQQAAETDRRLSNLEAEIAALKIEAQSASQTEIERFGKDTAAEIAKVQAGAQEEIAAAGKAARMDLQRYSAHLAVGLAAEKVRARMTPDAQQKLVRGFVKELERPTT